MPIAMCYLGRECHVSLKLGGGEGVILFWGVLCEGVIFWSLQLANVNKKSVLLADSFVCKKGKIWSPADGFIGALKGVEILH